jgi:2-keto-3-deoxy-L-rhamnonate aldolase RhmA
MKEAVIEVDTAGIVVGTFCDTREAAKRWIDVGVRYVVTAVDTGIYLQGCRNIIQGLKR